MVLSASIVPTPDATPAARQLLHQARRKLGRWLLLGAEISVAKAHDMMGDAAFREHLEFIRLLADGEWEAMFPKDRHTSVWVWCYHLVSQLGAHGHLGSPQSLLLCGDALSNLRGQANDLLSCLDRDIPYPYAPTSRASPRAHPIPCPSHAHPGHDSNRDACDHPTSRAVMRIGTSTSSTS